MKKINETSMIHTNNFHKSMRFLFVISQIFGFFPCQGVLKADVEQIHFKWISIRVVSAMFNTIGGYFIAISHIIHMSFVGYEQFEMNGVIFYACGATSSLLFLKLAKDWHKIMKKWNEVDIIMVTYGWPKNLNRKIRIISSIFLILEATEHISIQTNKVLVAVNCRGDFLTGLDHFFYNMSFPHVFYFLPYSVWEGIIFQMVNSRMAFSWTFLDLFLILISCGLASRFKQVNERVQFLASRKVQNEKTWERVREDYNALCRLCYYIDNKISLLVLLSFGNNIYFITIQIFGTIHIEETILERVYFLLSLMLLLLRLVSVCYYGSWINDETRYTLHILAAAPYDIYNKEILTAVVTYELVLIQFSRNPIDEHKPTKNSIC